VKISVGEVTGKETVTPFPDERWNGWNTKLSPREHLVCVQSVHVDHRNNLWILDAGNPLLQGVLEDAPKLLKVDLQTNRVVQKIHFREPVVKRSSYLNDVRVDARGKFAYLTDSGTGALLVVDLTRGSSRRVLDGHTTVMAEKITFKVEGVEIPLKIHSDGIALHPGGDFVYFQALTGRTLYRVPVKILADPKIPGNRLGESVEEVAKTGVADGLAFDPEGNLYITSLENNAIKRLSPKGELSTVIRHELIKWPDSISITSGKELYFTTSQLHLGPHVTHGYKVYKIKL
jgi:sugar lactone lactonase YvrE